MTKIWDSKLGHGVFEPHSTNLNFLSGKAATACEVAEKSNAKGGGAWPIAPPPPMYLRHCWHWLIHGKHFCHIWKVLGFFSKQIFALEFKFLWSFIVHFIKSCDEFLNVKYWYWCYCIDSFQERLDVMGPRVLHFCSQRLSEEIFPDKLKNAKVIPIFKVGTWDRC